MAIGDIADHGVALQLRGVKDTVGAAVPDVNGRCDWDSETERHQPRARRRRAILRGQPSVPVLGAVLNRRGLS